jgi:hypothetical protein
LLAARLYDDIHATFDRATALPLPFFAMSSITSTLSAITPYYAIDVFIIADEAIALSRHAALSLTIASFHSFH